MPIDAPLAFGPFVVDVAGRLSPRDPAQETRFSFTWRARPMLVRLSDGQMDLQAVAGRVPSTAQAAAGRPSGRHERAQILAFLPRLAALLPPEWRPSLAADHRLLMLSTVVLTVPPMITDLLAAITSRLLALAPYLDVLEEAGLRPRPGAVSGSASLGAAIPGAGGTNRV